MVAWPAGDGDLSRWMRWLMTAHVRRYLVHYHHSGHIWQGRSKAFPAPDDGHLLTVLRYFERNALRTGLVTRAEEWPWSSFHPDRLKPGPRLDLCPVPRPADWVGRVNAAMTPTEEESVRASIRRGTPPGTDP